MSNRQADVLRIDVLGRETPERVVLGFKPAVITRKRLRKLEPGVLLEGLDPLHLRLMRQGRVIAHAKLGRIDRRETIHIVSTDVHDTIKVPDSKHRLLEGRLRLLDDSEYRAGDVQEFDEPLTHHIVLLVDHEPIALGELVEYDDEPIVRITRMLDG
jgi:hypothetical protein